MIKKSIGVIRKVDDTGRVSIPKDFRNIVPIKQVEIILLKDSKGQYSIELKPISKSKE